ncbi:MAG: PaaI family thioesterase [Anaerolineales bacterium]
MTKRNMRNEAQSWLEVGEAMIRGEAPQPPIANLVGFQLVTLERGKSTMVLEAGEQHANPMGTLHGGVLCDVADAAMGMAFASTLEAGETFTTLELKINFLKTLWDGQLQAAGRVVKRGRTIGLVDCEVLDDDGTLVARASSTCMVLQGGRAEGR